MAQENTLEVADYGVMAGHFVLTVAVVIWSITRSSRGHSHGYFLAGRDMAWWLVGFSLYISDIGSISLIGIAGAAAADGIAVICYEFTGIFCVLLLGFVFAPVYISASVYTMPEYLRKRFGSRRLQIYLAVQNLLLLVFTKLSAGVFVGVLIVQQVLGWDVYLSLLVLLTGTALYTLLGGLTAIIYTDALQTVVLLVGSTVLAVIALVRIEGYDGLQSQYFLSLPNGELHGNGTCGLPDPQAFHIIRDISDTHYPWTGSVFGASVLSAWYFCTNQVLVQRTLAARNTLHAKAGCILEAYLKVLPLFLIVLPGMASRALFSDTVACSSPESCTRVCGNSKGCSNIAYPTLILQLMPVGLKGLMFAAILTALMSSLSSIFNSGSTVFTIDIWKKIRKRASEWEIMIVGRLFIVVFGGFSIAWLPIVGGAREGQLLNYLQSVNSYLAPPVLACFVMAIAWSRVNEPGAFWGLLVGLILGVARMIADFALPAPPCGIPDNRPGILKKFHFLNYACVLFVLCIIVTVVVSILTKPQEKKDLVRLTWSTKSDLHLDEDTRTEPKNMVFSVSKEIGALEISEEIPEDISETSRQGSSTKATLELPAWKKVLYWICGYNALHNDSENAEEHKAIERRMALLAMEENPKWRRVVNVNLVICLSVGAFLWGFFR
ncbi:sodium/glucose cotransporter 4 [Lingula anatina]|uniref:Sodium/glucose cotransporter 4 n=1 Tax=Lingula anatina TaxID=7574 RepID=A0A1S3K8R1_LINAN|nr:sodium/glucose cotransporter 4 [Lingula anatina]|eukprot:XP_013419013.1 sodium/glucose cotransporter 4 [Lingula anatina]